jgi:hypothetical protein
MLEEMGLGYDLELQLSIIARPAHNLGVVGCVDSRPHARNQIVKANIVTPNVVQRRERRALGHSRAFACTGHNDTLQSLDLGQHVPQQVPQLDSRQSDGGPGLEVETQARQTRSVDTQRTQRLGPCIIRPRQVVDPVASARWVCRVYVADVDFQVGDASLGDGVEGVEEGMKAVDGREAEPVVGEQRTSVDFAVEAPAGQKQGEAAMCVGGGVGRG